MGKLSLAATNMTPLLPPVQALVTAGTLGSDPEWPTGWVFDNHIPARILDDKSETALIVFSQRTWQDANEHNTAKFPLLVMDIWAAPLKDSQNSIVEYNAEDIIEDVFDAIFPYFHTVNKDVPGNTGDSEIPYMGSPGQIRYWGTADQIASKTGYPIFSSTSVGIEDFRPVESGNGAMFRRHTFGIETA